MSASNATRVALVTGANKGIGWNIVNQLLKGDPTMIVLVGARDASKGAEAVSKLASPNARPITIDIDSESSIKQAADQVKKEYDGLDILVNNAGTATKGDDFNEEIVKKTFKTNYYGTLHCINTFLPLMRPNGKIINVSSGTSVSALANMSAENRNKFLDDKLTMDGLTALMEDFRKSVAEGTWEAKGYHKSAYGMSKVGVSIMTRILARTAMHDGITINSGCPGWCKTDMAGDRAPRTAEEGATNFSHIALLPHDKMTNGEFWEDSNVSSLTRKPTF